MPPFAEPKELLIRLSTGALLSPDEAAHAFANMLSGNWGEAEIAALLTALRLRGETVDELVGAATALRSGLPPLETPIPGLLDTCGTGGDHASTFNISTAVAIVVSGCGVPVAKHGNRSVSSKSGSADVLGRLGCDIDSDQQTVWDCLHQVGLAFFFAPHWHKAMRHVGPVRIRLGFRTIFNLIGPLCNPANAEHQLVGVGRLQTAMPSNAAHYDAPRLVAQALARLGTKSSIVVNGLDGLDEVSLAAPTTAHRIASGAIVTEVWHARDFGLPETPLAAITVESPEQSAAVIRHVLSGQASPHRDYVLANAAAALLAAQVVDDLPGGVQRAAQAIDSGAALAKLNQLSASQRANRG